MDLTRKQWNMILESLLLESRRDDREALKIFMKHGSTKHGDFGLGNYEKRDRAGNEAMSRGFNPGNFPQPHARSIAGNRSIKQDFRQRSKPDNRVLTPKQVLDIGKGSSSNSKEDLIRRLKLAGRL